ncbi:MAG: hypothetical protein QOC71_1872 [Thermoplasmata archaeon]|jgi:signal transduction histidine kinase|nr:hypothetical protein [Thermoplasmata archaeon]
MRPRAGYLHIGPDWRITFAHLEGGQPTERTPQEIEGRVLWDLYPELAGSPFEAHYRAVMADRVPRTFDAVYGPANLLLENRLYPAGDGIALVYEDVTRRKQLQSQLDRRNRQQEAVARLGQAALEGSDVSTMFDRAATEVAQALGVEFAKIVEPTGDGKTLILRAGVGWRDGIVGQATMSAEGRSQAVYALQAHGPVIVSDFATETRFTASSLFVEHGIVSGLSVLIGPRDQPIGVLGAHSRERREFTQDDLNFMQAVANLLAAAITRSRIEAELRRHRDALAEDIERRRELEIQLGRRNLQQEAVARLGQAALEGVEVPYLLDQAVHEVAQALGVEFTKFVMPSGDGRTLLLRSGVGWRKGVIGEARLSAASQSQAGYALKAHGPVIVDEMANETRFSPPPLFVEHGIVSGLSVLVGPRDQPIGVLGAHSRERRHFTQDDLNFMQAVANLLAAAITRNRIDSELRRHRDDLEGLVQERTRRLEAMNKELAAFSYSVSHDLRTPLRAIDGFSQILVRQHAEALPPSAQALLGKVQENAQRMGHLIEALLSLSRLGRKELEMADVDLGALADQALSVLAAASPDRRVAVSVAPDLVARGDPELLLVLMGNLLGNAWKFSSGRAKARIEVGRDRTAAEPTFFVRDNGAGFDMEHADNLFQPFQRLHSTSEFEGTGVGLATVHRIVLRHGGRVWAEAEPGKGATFWFTLPGTVPGASPASPVGSPAASPDSPPSAF